MAEQENAPDEDYCVMIVSIFDEHREHADKLKAGDRARLVNVNPRISSDGYLEARLHGERFQGESKKIAKLYPSGEDWKRLDE